MAGEGCMLETNRAIAVRFVESLSNLDPALVRAQMTEDGLFEVMFRSEGLPLVRQQTVEQFCAQMLQLKDQFFSQGLRHVVTGSIVEGDWVAVESECRALAPNGKLYNNLYHWRILLRDGKVASAREYCDFLHAKEVFFAGME